MSQSAENGAQWSVVAEDGTSVLTSEDVARTVATGVHGYTLGIDRSPVVYAFTRPSPDDEWERVIPPAKSDEEPS